MILLGITDKYDDDCNKCKDYPCVASTTDTVAVAPDCKVRIGPSLVRAISSIIATDRCGFKVIKICYAWLKAITAIFIAKYANIVPILILIIKNCSRTISVHWLTTAGGSIDRPTAQTYSNI